MRYVILHAESGVIDEDHGAHAFGPFGSFDEAEAFNEADDTGDDCYKVAIPIIGPYLADIERAIAEEADEGAAHRPPETTG